MTISDSPAFAKGHQSYSAVATVAVPLTGGNSYLTATPDSTVLLATAGVLGTIVTALSAMPRATAAAANLTLWKSSDNGATKSPFLSVTHPGATVSTSAATAAVAFNHPGTTTPISESNPLRLAGNERLYAGSAVALAGGWQFSGVGVDISDTSV